MDTQDTSEWMDGQWLTKKPKSSKQSKSTRTFYLNRK